MPYINKPSITAAMKAYNLSYHYVAKMCELTYSEFHGIMYHKSNRVYKKNYNALCKFFEFNEFGSVVKIPHIERLEQIKAERKLAIVEQIKANERRRLIKLFITYGLMFTGLCAIIAFGYNDLLEWLK
jgi:hypothetical protein